MAVRNRICSDCGEEIANTSYDLFGPTECEDCSKKIAELKSKIDLQAPFDSQLYFNKGRFVRSNPKE